MEATSTPDTLYDMKCDHVDRAFGNTMIRTGQGEEQSAQLVEERENSVSMICVYVVSLGTAMSCACMGFSARVSPVTLNQYISLIGRGVPPGSQPHYIYICMLLDVIRLG